jgi:hypothetical protein
MAKKNPMDEGRPVPLDLAAKHIPILRARLNDWLDGVRRDLKAPERLRHPDDARQEAQAFERLLVAGRSFSPPRRRVRPLRPQSRITTRRATTKRLPPITTRFILSAKAAKNLSNAAFDGRPRLERRRGACARR